MASPKRALETANAENVSAESASQSATILNNNHRTDIYLVLFILILGIIFPVSGWIWGLDRAGEASGDVGRANTIIALLGVVMALIGAVIALYTFWKNAESSREQVRLQHEVAQKSQRKQHTINILLEMRMSPEFRTLNEQRKAVFTAYNDISYDDWNRAREASANARTERNPKRISDAQTQTNAAEALTSVLNYYEFLALGIRIGDLDEDLLKRSLRGMMCNLVDDARDVIAGLRETSDKTYEHLVWLYGKWRIDGAKDIYGGENERPIPAKSSKST